MKKPMNAWLWMLPLLWPLWCSAADGQDVECLDPSPTIQQGKDPYGPIAVRELTPGEQEALKGLLISLEGEWQGHARDVHCRSIKDARDQKVNRYDVKADIDVDYYGNFFIQVNLYSKEKKTSHKEVLRLYLTQKKLRVNSSSGYGDVELISATSTSIAFLYRLLLKIEQSKGSSRKEYFVSLDLTGNELIIHQKIYSQGRLSYRQQWYLSPR